MLSCMGSYLVAVTFMKPKEVDMEEAEEQKASKEQAPSGRWSTRGATRKDLG